MHMVAGKLRELFANSVYIIRDTGVVLLMSRAHDDELTSSELSEWREVLLSMRVRVGVSNPFESPSDACRALEQARRALESGQRLNPSECLFRFEDYQFIDLAARLSESDDLSVYLYPPLKSIIDLDIQKRTNLAYTLYVYLQYARQSPKVCEKLSIHKNTLYYRLNRISTIMNINFEESDAIQRQLLLSFEIIKFNGEFDRLPK